MMQLLYNALLKGFPQFTFTPKHAKIPWLIKVAKGSIGSIDHDAKYKIDPQRGLGYVSVCQFCIEVFIFEVCICCVLGQDNLFSKCKFSLLFVVGLMGREPPLITLIIY